MYKNVNAFFFCFQYTFKKSGGEVHITASQSRAASALSIQRVLTQYFHVIMHCFIWFEFYLPTKKEVFHVLSEFLNSYDVSSIQFSLVEIKFLKWMEKLEELLWYSGRSSVMFIDVSSSSTDSLQLFRSNTYFEFHPLYPHNTHTHTYSLTHYTSEWRKILCTSSLKSVQVVKLRQETSLFLFSHIKTRNKCDFIVTNIWYLNF